MKADLPLHRVSLPCINNPAIRVKKQPGFYGKGKKSDLISKYYLIT